ncbi:hypothetical protein [Alteribacter keqinensis]|uniref:hypothetical protein n=1 Tax=Alteribacter keqinensis TaxID=2483800 RepID=UPI0032119B02
MEGVHNEPWVNESFERAGVILFLDPTYRIRTYRIVKRYMRQKLGLENYKPTFAVFAACLSGTGILKIRGSLIFFSGTGRMNRRSGSLKDILKEVSNDD